MKTERFDEGMVLRQVRQLAPELEEKVRRYLHLLPPNWHLGIPTASRDHHGEILKGVIAHALLSLLDPQNFPAARQTRALVGYLAGLRSYALIHNALNNTEDIP